MLLSKKFKQYYDAFHEEDAYFENEIGRCCIPDLEHIEEIAKYLNLPKEYQVDLFEFNNVLYLSFQNHNNWRHKFYCLNLFTLHYTSKSEIKKPLPQSFYDMYKKHIKMKPVIEKSTSVPESLFIHENHFNVLE